MKTLKQARTESKYLALYYEATKLKVGDRVILSGFEEFQEDASAIRTLKEMLKTKKFTTIKRVGTESPRVKAVSSNPTAYFGEYSYIISKVCLKKYEE